MTRLAVAAACCLWAATALAQDKMKTPGAPAKAKSEMKTEMGAGAGMGWMPRKVTHEDKKGIEEMLTQDEAAWMKGDMAGVAANVDFPVYMVTDDSKGMVYTDAWTKDQWMKEMADAMKNMPKDMKMKHNRKYMFLTDDMAIVYDNMSATMGKQKMSWNSAELVVKKNGKWMIKSMMEGGWGDMAKAKGTMTDTKG